MPQLSVPPPASSPVSIRLAEPADAQFLAWTILTASRGHLSKGWFDIALNRPEPDVLEFLQSLTTATLRSRWHYSRFLVAQSQSQLVAALCAFGGAEVYRESPAAIEEVLESLGFGWTERELVWLRGAYLFSCTEAPGDGVWTIESIATLPEHRQQGYGGLLLARTLEDGRSQGLREAEVLIFIGNASAERAYHRAGFHFSKEWRDGRCEIACGSPGLRRLSKAL